MQRRSGRLVTSILLLLLLVGGVLFLLFNRQPAEPVIAVPTVRPTEILTATATASHTPTALPSRTPTPPPSATVTASLSPTRAPSHTATRLPDTPTPDLPPLPAPVEVALGVPIFSGGIPPNLGRFGGLYDNAALVNAGHIMLTIPGGETFHIDAFEVTNLQLVTFLNASRLSDTPLIDGVWIETSAADAPLRQDADGYWELRSNRAELLPARYVSALAARAYCANLGGSLPSLAQWQQAALWAQDEGYRAFPWGTAPPTRDRANFAGDALLPGQSLESGRSWAGVYHLVGNVAEWVLLADGQFGVIGGSFQTSAGQIATAAQEASPARAGAAFADVGFRCVRLGG